MVNKKGYLKTLEALIAIAILLIFITTALNINRQELKPSTPDDIRLMQDTIFNKIQTDPLLRGCLTAGTFNCINDTVNETMIETLDFMIEMCTGDPNNCLLTITLPEDKTIYSDSIFIQEINPSGTDQYGTLRLFLWRKVE
jgi:hypothetical protein